MRRLKVLFFLVNIFFIQLIVQTHWKRAAESSEVHVNLLGQPCLLSGPYDDSTLNLIHSLGPAQLYPNLSNLNQPTGTESIVRALSKIQNPKNLPALLDRYRERLTRRLQQQQRFIQAIRSKTPSVSLLKLGKEFIRGPEMKKFESLLKQKTGVNEQLFEIFNDSIEPDPEADFHRAIKQLQIQYNCSFEESEPTAETPGRQSD